MAILDNVVWIDGSTGFAESGSTVVSEGGNSTIITGDFSANAWDTTSNGTNVSDFGTAFITQPITATWGFSNPVEDLSFTLEHVSSSGTTYDDEFTIRIYDENGVLIPSADVIAAISGNTNVTIYANPDGSVVVEADNDVEENITFNLTGFQVSEVDITFDVGPDGTQTGGAGISDFSFTIPPEPDFVVDGTAGNDTIDATYVGDPEGDLVDNNDHSDGSNDDSIRAGAGDDVVFAGQGNDTVMGSDGADTLFGGAGNDSLDGDDALAAGAADSIDGGAGNDTLIGDVGDDTLIGGSGDDTIFSGADNDIVAGGAGADEIYGEAGNDLLGGGGDNDTLRGNDGADNITGGSGDDSLDGGADNDTLQGGTGDDILDGDTGNDVIYGDTDPTLNGGANPETSAYYNTGNGDLFTYDASTGTSTLLQSGLQTYGDIAVTSDGTIYGITFLAGSEGIYEIDPITGTETLAHPLPSSTYATLTAGPDNALYYSDNNTGELFQIAPDGSGGFTTTSVGTLPTPSYDIVFTDTDTALVLSDGTVFQYDVSPTGVFSNQTDLGTVNGQTDVYGLYIDGNGTVHAIEGTGEVLSTDPNSLPLTWTSETGATVTGPGIYGAASVYDTGTYDLGSGADTINAGAGDDTVFGGAGDDDISGEAGNDVLDGGIGADSLDGGDDADTITGGGGDTVDGGSGGTDADLLIVNDVASIDISGLDSNGNGYDGVVTFNDSSTLTFSEIEAFEVNGAPWTPDNIVSGTSGDDVIDGSYTGDPDGNEVDDGDALGTHGEAPNSNADSIEAGAGNDTVNAGADNDTVDGGTGDDVLFGNSGDDSIIGGAGNDVFQGDSGNDTLLGGADADRFEQWRGDGNDTVVGGETGTDSDVLWTVDSTDGVNVVFTGTEAGVSTHTDGTSTTFSEIEQVWGSSQDDVIDASASMGDQTLQGEAGEDTITGGAGNDSLRGGDGADSILGGAGNDSITGGNDSDVLSGGAGNDTLHGDGGDDTIYTGTGDDLVTTGSGNDIVYTETGNDTVDAGLGSDDIYVTEGTGSAVLTGGEDAGNGEKDCVILDATGTQGGTIIMTGEESGTYAFDSGNGDGTFTEMEVAVGSQNDDVIDASATTDGFEVMGRDGDDSITMGSGNDYVLAGQGADTIEGGAGNDVIDLGNNGSLSTDGDADVVVLSDGSGQDSISWVDIPTDNGDGTFTGVDTLDVTGLTSDGGTTPVHVGDVVVTDDGTGNALLTFPGGESLLMYGVDPTFASNPAVLEAFGIPPNPNDNIVQGTGGDDVIGLGYVDTDGTEVDANDALGTHGEVVGSNADSIEAGDGNDSVLAGEGNDTVLGGSGNDTLDGQGGDDTLNGGDGDDTLSGGAGDDVLLAGVDAGNDSLDGGVGNDTLNGEDGEDTLSGGTGDDRIFAGTGDDVVILENNFGSDTIFGGSAFETNGDTLDLSAVTNNTTVDLSDDNRENGTVSDGSGTTSFTDIENIILGSGRDTVILADGSGDANTDSVTAFDMTDSGDGTAMDQLDVSGLTSDGGTTPVTTNDVVVSDTNGDGTGDAILTFPGGEAIILVGVTRGQVDTPAELQSIGIPAGLNYIVEGTGGDDLINAGYVGDPEGDRIDNLDHSDGTNNDSVFAGAGDDTINAGAGNDTVDAGTGNDEVYGDAGNDTLVGGAGLDTLSGDEGNDSLSGGADADSLDGGAGTDTLNGGEGADYLDGGTGADSVIGGDGNDTLIGGLGTDADTLNAGAGDDSVRGGSGDDSINGGIGNDILHGDAGDDTIQGSDGLDTIYGGEGNDSLSGGADDDSIEAWLGDDTLDGGDGNDYLDGAEGADSLVGGAGNDTLLGGSDAGEDTLYGGAGNDSLSSGDDNDLLFGGTGDDTIFAGSGDDIIVVQDGFGNDQIDGWSTGETIGDQLDASGLTEDVVLDLSAGDPNDPESGTLSNGTDTLTFIEIENVILGAGDDSVTGSAGDDTISVNAGSDTVDGGAGDDVINLSEVEGALYDGSVDTLIFEDGDGNDTVGGFEVPTDNLDGTFAGLDQLDVTDLTDANGAQVNTSDVIVTDTNGDGTGDAILQFPNGESITLQGADPSYVDNPLVLQAMGIPMPDYIVEGTGGADLIDDSYVGDPEGDIVDGGDNQTGGDADLIDAGAGNDTVLAGAGDDTILGGAGDDSIIGGAGADEIQGGLGNDTMVLGSGDTATGGDGDDVFNVNPDDLNGADLTIIGGEGDETVGDTLNVTGPATIVFDDPSEESGTITYDLTGEVVTFSEIENLNYVPCFTPGTLIKTDKGEIPVEQVQVGTRVLTLDHGYQTVVWAGARHLDSETLAEAEGVNPILIRQGSLGKGLPDRDMMVSPQHRVLIQNAGLELFFGESEVLVPAKFLAMLPGFEQVMVKEVTYIHFMFEHHEVVMSDGCWTESFQPGDLTIGALGDAAREEIFDLFPDLNKGKKAASIYPAARATLNQKEARVLLHS